MKSKLLFIALLALGFSTVPAQSQTTVYAKNSDISDNLDLRAVASIFGESANLQDFERRLNDPKYQISNLDLNDDDEVDYLRVIESVEDRTHVIIIQAVLDRDVYQDIATIDVERDNSNKVVVQVVGNSYLYGDNYIYEPVYNVTPVIYTSFWITNYRPYYSTWGWNYYPNYYTAWRPYPIYRYRNNINVCINVNNHYNYVNNRRSYRAPALYETRRSYGYETRRPNYSFSQRHANTNNRYELDQRRVASRESNRNQNVYNTNRSNSGRTTGTDRNYADNRNAAVNRPNSDRNYNTNRATPTSRDNSPSVNTPARVENTQRNEVRRNSNDNNSRVYSENRGNSNRTSAPVQRTEAPRSMPENRGGSENRGNTSRAQAPQRAESPRVNQESRGSQPQRENSSGSRGGNRRG
ncbi:hypothetical protein D0809_10125 [Flavobacterium circumlabens]|uniref:DUF3300 domain-containing protein n=1 Tax=Flavobacterium circumlabens TaxID=2133765 RepID=A0A4Y7UCP7_9FLAO|nr:hypothetical protein [Flavobacterium circumlabens]TCN58695.1 hypothetical protein EV142_103134 [Flavobacterium circumlabens]TEB44114.1 hypothetical protein D0809_10125 [Flavobacterium circumlabens]